MTTAVRAFCRIRPALQREVDTEGKLQRCVAQAPGEPVLHVATKPGVPVIVESDGSTTASHVRTFKLDGVFDETVGTDDVYATACHGLVESVLSGVNSTMMCYGMTGSGKSFTMLGSGGKKGALVGLVGLAAQDLFAKADASSGMVTIEVAFMQLYGTVATDLLVDSPAPLKIARREGEILVEGQSRRHVATPNDVAAVVREGAARRKVASQKLNSASSRSHAVLTFFISSFEADENSEASSNASGSDDDSTAVARVTKLVCVDLAGSERVKESGVEGVALREAQAINLSLFHLIRVVQILNERSKITARTALSRVPYADSPLTLLLSDALGGSCRTALIATLSPAQEHAVRLPGSNLRVWPLRV